MALACPVTRHQRCPASGKHPTTTLPPRPTSSSEFSIHPDQPAPTSGMWSTVTVLLTSPPSREAGKPSPPLITPSPSTATGGFPDTVSHEVNHNRPLRVICSESSLLSTDGGPPYLPRPHSALYFTDGRIGSRTPHHLPVLVFQNIAQST